MNHQQLRVETERASSLQGIAGSCAERSEIRKTNLRRIALNKL
jgi:hypothetical protein